MLDRSGEQSPPELVAVSVVRSSQAQASVGSAIKKLSMCSKVNRQTTGAISSTSFYAVIALLGLCQLTPRLRHIGSTSSGASPPTTPTLYVLSAPLRPKDECSLLPLGGLCNVLRY